MRRAIVLILLVLMLAGCASGRPVKHASLKEVLPPDALGSNPTQATVRMAAASIISPQETIRSYGTFFRYLERQIGQPVEVLQRKTYEESAELLRVGTLDLAMICTFVYVQLQDQIGLDLLAAPEVNGKAEYHSYIIVRTESGITTFNDLKGKRFAYTDPLSTSGKLYPTALLKTNGWDPGNFFASTTYTYSHDNSIRAVVQGVVDGAAVDSLVYEQWVKLHPQLGTSLSVIGRSEALPSPPIVATHRLDAATRETLRRTLLEMHLTPEGKEILAALGIDRFVPQDDGQYEPVRKIARKAGLLP